MNCYNDFPSAKEGDDIADPEFHRDDESERLLNYYKTQRDHAKALRWARCVFESHPAVYWFQEMAYVGKKCF